jgi:radical SAM superfamily enzyme YgiQ (UPF0313 family)
MKQLLIISFDLIRPSEIETPLAIASLLSFLKHDPYLRDQMDFHHLSINSFNYRADALPNTFDDSLLAFDLENISFIAISAYIWNEYSLNGFIKHLRELGFRGQIILGGYQITYANKQELPLLYPDAQIFISGYAEQSLKDALTAIHYADTPRFLDSPIDFDLMPSPYLTGEIMVPEGTPMLRLETKRGCPYRCSFCSHRDLSNNKVFKHPLEKVFQEISFIIDKKVSRVNILDPVFNAGKDYLDIMQEINKSNSRTTFTLQSRLENIKSESGRQFLELCGSGNYHLEFGLQTINITESENIKRKNNLTQIDQAFEQLRDLNINYEVSLIYGLPGQTHDSFQRSIEYVRNKGCKTIKAYPLMLLRGTELYHEKIKWNLKEEVIGDFNIPVVVSSNSFSHSDWENMHDTASKLTPHERN